MNTMKNEVQRLENVWFYRLLNSRGGTWMMTTETKEEAARKVWHDGLLMEDDDYKKEGEGIMEEMEGPVTISVLGEPLDLEQDLIDTHSGWRIWKGDEPTNHFVLSTLHQKEMWEDVCIKIDDEHEMRPETFYDDAFGLVHLN